MLTDCRVSATGHLRAAAARRCAGAAALQRRARCARCAAPFTPTSPTHPRSKPPASRATGHPRRLRSPRPSRRLCPRAPNPHRLFPAGGWCVPSARSGSSGVRGPARWRSRCGVMACARRQPLCSACARRAARSARLCRIPDLDAPGCSLPAPPLDDTTPGPHPRPPPPGCHRRSASTRSPPSCCCARRPSCAWWAGARRTCAATPQRCHPPRRAPPPLAPTPRRARPPAPHRRP